MEIVTLKVRYYNILYYNLPERFKFPITTSTYTIISLNNSYRWLLIIITYNTYNIMLSSFLAKKLLLFTSSHVSDNCNWGVV